LKELSLEELGDITNDDIMNLQNEILKSSAKRYINTDNIDAKALLGLTKSYFNLCNVDMFTNYFKYNKNLDDSNLKSQNPKFEKILNVIDAFSSELEFI
jgi:hypothetical protein